MSAEYKEKLRSLNFGHRPTTSKKTVDHTDTAVVTTVTKDESQDVNVLLKDAVRPHCPEMTQAYHKERQNA